MCDDNCTCILCLELSGCDVVNGAMGSWENFILKPAKEPKKYIYFGMEDAQTLKKSFGSKVDINNNDDGGEALVTRHKSIIYVESTPEKDNDQVVSGKESQIIRNEVIDEYMSLNAAENSNVIIVVFKETFALATQFVNEITSSCPIFYDSCDEDDFPLGMEAEYLTRNSCYYLKKKWFLSIKLFSN